MICRGGMQRQAWLGLWGIQSFQSLKGGVQALLICARVRQLLLLECELPWNCITPKDRVSRAPGIKPSTACERQELLPETRVPVLPEVTHLQESLQGEIYRKQGQQIYLWQTKPPALPRMPLPTCKRSWFCSSIPGMRPAFCSLRQFQLACMQTGEHRVMGVAQNAIATKLATRRELLWDVPANWSAAQV